MKTIRQHQVSGRNANLHRRILPLLIAACFAGDLQANPVGPQVVNGQVSFVNQGNTLSITNTPGTIINWQGFSINPGELTRFLQQNSNSAVLNRVTGGDPSQILGALQSNGKVFLINPNGILFGQGAQIDVNGLVASTLNIRNEDFLLGRMNFQAGSVAGNIKNQGSITTPNGGQVLLIAPNVENSGIITSPKGEVLLAAGHTVQLVDSSNPDLHVVLSAPENEALNLGQIIAQGGRTGIYGGLVKQRGIINANSAVRGENGKIVFKASRETLLEDGSRTTATGAGVGGEIEVLGNHVGLTGDATIDASGQQGGGTVLVGGDYQGANPLVKNASGTYVGKDALIKADAADYGDGGKVIVWADDATRFYGRIFARGGARGGNGGFTETSGKKFLDFKGRTDLLAPAGISGTLLLDPTGISIDDSLGSTDVNTAPNYDNTGGGSVITSSDLISALSSSNVTITSAAGITVNSSFGFSNQSLTLNATGNIDVNQSISGGAGSDLIMHATAGNIAQNASGSISVTNLEAHASGSVTLNNSSNGIGTVAGSAGGSFSVTNGANLQVGSNGITASGGDVSLSGNGITFVSGGNISASTGTVNLTSTGANALTSIVSGAAISGANINIKTDNLDLNGTLSTPGTAAITRYTDSQTTPVEIQVGGTGSDGVAALNINSNELTKITANTYRFGDTSTAGGLLVAGAVTMPAGKTLSLLTSSLVGSQIVQNTNATVTADYLRAEGGSGVTLNDANSVKNIAGKTLMGDFQFRNVGALNLSTIDTQIGIDAGANKVNLTTTGDLSQSIGAIIKAGGLAVDSTAKVTLTELNKVSNFAGNLHWASSSALDFWSAQDLTVGAVTGTGFAGITGITAANSDVTPGTTSSINVKTTTGNLTVGQAISVTSAVSGSATTALTAAAGLNLNAAVSSTFNTIRDGAIKLVVGTSGIASNANGVVTADTLEVNSGGAASLGNAHAINKIAASVGGNLTLGSSTSIDIGTVGSTSGINGPGMVSLHSIGAITQTQPIGATSLQVSGSTVDLLLSNPVGVIAGRASGGSFAYKSHNGIHVTSVDGVDGVQNTSSGGNITLVSETANISQDAPITTMSNAGLSLAASTDIILQHPGNNVRKLAASAGTGAINFFNAVPLDIDTVGGVTGLTTTGGPISVTAGGLLAIKQNVNAGSQSAAFEAPDVQIGGAAGISMNAGFIKLRANKVGTPGTISTQGNSASTLTSTSGLALEADQMDFSAVAPTFNATTEIVYKTFSDDRPITIGTACHGGGTGCLVIGGATTNAPDLVIGNETVSDSNTAGDIWVDSALSHAGGRVALLTGGGIGQTAAITADSLGFIAGTVTNAAGVTLNAANSIANVAGTTNGGAVSLTNTPALSVVQITGGDPMYSNVTTINGIATNGGNITIQNTGNVTLAAPLVAGAGVLSLTSSAGSLSGSGGGVASGASLNASAANGINMLTDVPLLSVDNSGTASDITISNYQPATYQNVRQTTAGSTGNLNISNSGAMIVGSGGAISAEKGSISVTAYHSLTIEGSVATTGSTAGQGNITLTAYPSNTTNGTDNLVINGSVASNAGNITLKAGDAITVNGSVTSVAGTVTQTPNLNANATTPPPPPPPSPTLDQCVADPSISGCSAVLPTLDACSADPTLAGCSVVLPSLSQCTADPTLAGCTTVLPSLSTCTVSPGTAGCTAVLPSLDICLTSPTTAGCTAVLPSLSTCTTSPTTAGCTAVLPSLSTCTTSPTTAGCTAVLPSLSTCTTSPTTAGCTAVLPSLSTCTTSPTTAGCTAVLPSLSTCTTSPTTAGCTAVLPSLATCTTSPTTTGCAAVLPSLATCTTSPTTTGCAVVLPSLSTCTTSPTTAGCTAVLPSLTTCTTSPTTAGCTVVLPTFDTCTAAPATAGCTVVLPSIDQCAANLSLAGCSAVLPTITQCSATPNLPGCSVVMPAASQCTTNPSLPECVTVLPPASPGTTGTVTDTITSTVNTVVATTSTQTTTVLTQPVSSTALKPVSSAGASTTSSPGGSTSSSSAASPTSSSNPSDGSKSEEKRDDRKDTAGPKDDGVKKNEPAKKLYCN